MPVVGGRIPGGDLKERAFSIAVLADDADTLPPATSKLTLRSAQNSR